MRLISIFISALLFLAATACGTSGKVGGIPEERLSNSTVENPAPAISLTEHLRKLSGVYVSGSGPNAMVTIRGVNSINAETEPLFVVDGQVINGGLRAASEFIQVADIQSIRVLKNPSETGFYGVRGANGVIEIKMKKN